MRCDELDQGEIARRYPGSAAQAPLGSCTEFNQGEIIRLPNLRGLKKLQPLPLQRNWIAS